VIDYSYRNISNYFYVSFAFYIFQEFEITIIYIYTPTKYTFEISKLSSSSTKETYKYICTFLIKTKPLSAYHFSMMTHALL